MRSLVSAKAFVLAMAVASILGCQAKDPLLIGTPPNQRKAAGLTQQNFNPTIDILFVIDDSGSMGTHQQNLAANIDLFLDGFKRSRIIDYHIGAISTAEEVSGSNGGAGEGGGRLNGQTRFIDKNTPNGLSVLRDNMLMGINGSGYERMFSPTVLALTEPNLSGWNAGFYRKNAHLAIVMITDAEDQSNMDDGLIPRGPGHQLNMDPQRFYDFLVRLKEQDKSKVLTYGAIIPEGTPTDQCFFDDMNMLHTRITQFFQLSRGTALNLCEQNWGEKLAEIGKDLATKVGKRVILDRRPRLNSIQVFYGTQVIPSDSLVGWSYDPTDNSITFGSKLVLDEQPNDPQLEIYFEPQ